MSELIGHALLIWIVSALLLILLYDKIVVQRQIKHNMYLGKKGYNRKRAGKNYLTYIAISGIFSACIIYLLRVLN